jgi:nucleoside-diphosphate-sugar epimerase
MTMLTGRNIAVTGATGFIGGRIVEYLTLATGAHVRCLVRSYTRLHRLADLPQDRLAFHRADLLDPGALRRALDGCDTVIHCAFGNDGTAEQQWHVTVDGTRNLIDAACALPIERIVHLGTAAIHDLAQARVLDEDAPRFAAPEGSYEAVKAAAEDEVVRRRPDAMVLRPTVVYGPWGRDWTVVPLQRLAAGVRLPAGDAGGVSNAVFVDDVARAAVLAAGCDASGPMIIAASELVTWGQFFDAFRALRAAPSPEATTEIEDWERSLYAATCRADIGRARRLLGYQPRVAFAAGMQRVASWDRWYHQQAGHHGGVGCPDGS